MDEKENKPSIRFAGFTNAWEQRKFDTLYAKSSEKNDGSIGVDRNITVATMQFKSDVKVSTDDYLKTYYTFNIGDIAFEGHQSKEFRFGRFVENDIGNGIVSHIFAVFRPIVEYDLRFWKYAINNERLMQSALSRSTKASTMMHDLVVGDFLNEEFLVPSIDEQNAIGDFLTNLDHLITLHQRKHDKLVNVKKSMLEKMFPQAGADVPEIRFAGFTGTWEQEKIGEIIEDYVEKTTIQNQFPVLTSSQQQGIVFQEDYFADRQVTTNDNIGYFILPKGYFTYRSRSDTDVFVFNRNNLIDKGIISYYYPVFFPRNADSNFLLRRLNHGIKSQLSMAAEGTGQRVLAHSKFKKMTVYVPGIDEQIQIGQFFEMIDHLINLHQRKLTKLQNIKKSCLEKMFI